MLNGRQESRRLKGQRPIKDIRTVHLEGYPDTAGEMPPKPHGGSFRQFLPGIKHIPYAEKECALIRSAACISMN